VTLLKNERAKFKAGLRKCNNIIEQVTDFKYLGYRISEYGSDLEDKLQT